VLKQIGKIIRSSSNELSANPRARSAVMRIAEKL
jgi:16S rRNA C1402 N4-methylase RsmH